MKTPLFLLLLLGFSRVATAQALAPSPKRHTVSVGVFGLAPTLGLEYALRLGGHGAIAVQGSRYFNAAFPGYQAALLGRYYLRPAAPSGFYVQAQAGAFRHSGHITSFYIEHAMTARPLGNVEPSGIGGGLGLGYQLLLGRYVALNASLGLKYYHLRSLSNCDCSYVGNWYSPGGPGSVLDGQLSIGYAF